MGPRDRAGSCAAIMGLAQWDRTSSLHVAHPREGPVAPANGAEREAMQARLLRRSKIAMTDDAASAAARPQRSCRPQRSAHPSRVHVEVGLLLLEARRVFAADDIARKRAHVAPSIGIEYQHAAEQLEHHHQTRIGVFDLHAPLPLATDGKHLAIEKAHGLIMLVKERVVATKINEVAPQ